MKMRYIFLQFHLPFCVYRTSSSLFGSRTNEERHPAREREGERRTKMKLSNNNNWLKKFQRLCSLLSFLFSQNCPYRFAWICINLYVYGRGNGSENGHLIRNELFISLFWFCVWVVTPDKVVYFFLRQTQFGSIDQHLDYSFCCVSLIFATEKCNIWI